MKIKRLMLDIETSLSVVATFSLWPKFISHDNILQDWHIICASWKWEDEDEIYNAKTYTTNDKQICKKLSKVINEADELVYHNGRKFDYKKINTRVLVNGLPPISKPRETDTLIQAKRHFSFTSNRLDYIAKVLVDDAKLTNKPGLWLEALNKNKQAIDDMSVYCDHDVVILEKVFQVMKPHIDLGYNAALDYEHRVCPSCANTTYSKWGFYMTKSCKYQKYRCKSCLSIFRDGSAEKRQNIVPR